MNRNEAVASAEQKVAIADYMLQKYMTTFDIKLVQDLLLTALGYLQHYSNLVPELSYRINKMPLTYNSAKNSVEVMKRIMQNLK